jgi:hypothetical protein
LQPTWVFLLIALLDYLFIALTVAVIVIIL